MLANRVLLFAFLVEGQNPLEVVLKGVVLHLIADIHASQRVRHNLVGESDKRADNSILLWIAQLDQIDEIIELLAKMLLSNAQPASPIAMVLGHIGLIKVGVLHADEEHEVVACAGFIEGGLARVGDLGVIAGLLLVE